MTKEHFWTLDTAKLTCFRTLQILRNNGPLYNPWRRRIKKHCRKCAGIQYLILSRSCARLFWNIYPLFTAHSICPGSSQRSLLLLFTFHHRQTLAWLCLSFKANLRHVMLNFHQHVFCPTRGPNTLDHCYSQFKNAYNARSLPAFGKSDHATIFSHTRI